MTARTPVAPAYGDVTTVGESIRRVHDDRHPVDPLCPRPLGVNSLAPFPGRRLARGMSDMWIEDGQDPRTYDTPQGEKATYVE